MGDSARVGSDASGNRVDLNGSELRVTANGDVPAIAGVWAASGAQALPPASISFFAISQANNAACPVRRVIRRTKTPKE